MPKVVMADIPVKKALLYLTIVAGFTASSVLAIGVGLIHLFGYRILLPLLWMLFAMSLLLNGSSRLTAILG